MTTGFSAEGEVNPLNIQDPKGNAARGFCSREACRCCRPPHRC